MGIDEGFLHSSSIKLLRWPLAGADQHMINGPWLRRRKAEAGEVQKTEAGFTVAESGECLVAQSGRGQASQQSRHLGPNERPEGGR